MRVIESDHALAPAERSLRALWEVKWQFLAIVGVFVVGSVVVTSLLPRSYTSEALLSVRPAPRLEPEATLYTAAVLGAAVKTDDFGDQAPRRFVRRLSAVSLVTLAARDAGIIPSNEKVDEQEITRWIDVQALEKTDLVDVTVSQPSAEAAQRFAIALIARAVDANKAENASPSTRQMLDEELTAAAAAMEKAERAVVQASAGRGDAEHDVQVDRNKLELSLAREQYAAVRKRLAALELILANQGFQLTLVDPPTVPQRPSFPRPVLNVSIGLILGILIATAFVVLRSVFART